MCFTEGISVAPMMSRIHCSAMHVEQFFGFLSRQTHHHQEEQTFSSIDGSCSTYNDRSECVTEMITAHSRFSTWYENDSNRCTVRFASL
jgi:hypothetical protein